MSDEVMNPVTGESLRHGRCDGCGRPQDYYDVDIPDVVYRSFLENESLQDLESDDLGTVSIGAIIDELIRTAREWDE